MEGLTANMASLKLGLHSRDGAPQLVKVLDENLLWNDSALEVLTLKFSSLSVVFHWLRYERSGKRFSHTLLKVWVQVCEGIRSHGSVPSSVCFLPSAIA